MKRLLLLVLSFSLIFSVFVVPVSASSTFGDDLPYIDVLEYGHCIESANNSQQMNDRGLLNFTYELPDRSIFTYVDILFNYNASASNFNVFVKNSTNNSAALTVVNVSRGLFRAYGSVGANYRGQLEISVSDANANTSWRVTMESVKIGFDSSYSVDTDCYADIRSSSYNSLIHYVPTDETNYRMWNSPSSLPSGTLGIHVYKEDWKAYDFLDFYMYIDTYLISTIDVAMGGKYVPHEVSTFVDSDVISNPYVYCIRLDLRGLDRSVDDYPQITISGLESNGYTNMVSVLSCVGSVYFNMTEPEVAWYQKLFNSISNGFTNLTSTVVSWYQQIISSISTEFTNLKSDLATKFSGVTQWLMTIRDRLNAMENAIVTKLQLIIDQFGNNRVDDELEDAKDTQEEVNVSINNQLVGAIEDWNTHIEIVETGYDSALTKTTPALIWVASLADRIFNNIGWFANVYFMIGLISVFMLILSKSGLFRSIDGASRRL